MLTADANVWIAAADPSDEFHAGSREFLLGVARQELRIFCRFHPDRERPWADL